MFQIKGGVSPRGPLRKAQVGDQHLMHDWVLTEQLTQGLRDWSRVWEKVLGRVWLCVPGVWEAWKLCLSLS